MSNGRIAVLCPTRGNPEGLKRAARSVIETASLADIMPYVDDDQSEIYGNVEKLFPSRMFKLVGPRVDQAAAVNQLVSTFPGYSAYGLITDDAEMKVGGWDRYVLDVLDHFPGRIGVVSGAHTLGGFVNFAYVSGQWIEAAGWYACPDTIHFCWDTVIEMLGEATEIVYAPKERFFIEHNHVYDDKKVQLFMMDAVKFLGWCINKRRDVVASLREAAVA